MTEDPYELNLIEIMSNVEAHSRAASTASNALAKHIDGPFAKTLSVPTLQTLYDLVADVQDSQEQLDDSIETLLSLHHAATKQK